MDAEAEADGHRDSAMAVQEPRAYPDENALVGGYLRDLALARSSRQKMFGYKRAAAAILSLEKSLTDLLLRDPSSECRH